METITWLAVIALAVQLLPLDPGLQVRVRWTQAEPLLNIASCPNEGLLIEFRTGSGSTLLSYLLLPWQDLQFLTTGSDKLPVLSNTYQLHTVTPFALVFQKRAVDLPQKKKIVQLDAVAEQMDFLLNFGHLSTRVAAEGSLTLPGQLQVIELTEYPNYVDLHIALPGSRPENLPTLREQFPGKMIRVTLVPDRGPVTVSWWQGTMGAQSEGCPDFATEILNIYAQALQNLTPKTDADARQMVYQNSVEKIDDILARDQHLSENCRQDYQGWLKRLLRISEPVQAEPVIELDFDNPFAGYEPKRTPDTVLDYCPALEEELARLPAAELANLPALYEVFSRYRRQAKKQPGRWVEGNLLLGALPQEYRPSEAELLLAETGARMRKIVRENDEQQLKKLLRAHCIERALLEYTAFRFIHYDVMGSGRFFYVGNMTTEKIRLP